MRHGSCSKPADWLPAQRAKLLLSQPLNLRFIKVDKQTSGLVSQPLCWKILEEVDGPNAAQGRINARETPAGLRSPEGMLALFW